MKIGKKNIVYSIVIATFVMLFLICYFVGRLPSLYVSYIEDRYVNSIIVQHKGYLSSKSYEGIKVKYPNTCITLDIPNIGDELVIASQMFQATIKINDAELLEFLNIMREKIADDNHFEISDFETNEKEDIIKMLERIGEELMGTIHITIKQSAFDNRNYDTY